MTKDQLESRIEALKGALSASEDARKGLEAELTAKTLECDLLAAMCGMVLQGRATMRMDGDRVKFSIKDRG